MRTFSTALAHVQRNYAPLLMYTGITAVYVACWVGIEYLLIDQIDLASLDQSARVYLVINGVVGAAVYAVARAIAFQRIAADIEKPVWKAHESPGAFTRFFAFWFTLGFVEIAAHRFIVLAPLDQSTAESLEMLWFLAGTVLTPFGAAVMFFGNTSRAEMGLAVHTLIAQLPRVLLICFISLFATMLLIGLQTGLEPYFLPALAIVYAYIDCFIFCYCWELCRDQREIEENSDDLDF